MTGQTETKAYVIKAKGSFPELQTIPLPALKKNEVEIKIQYCGLCHSDIKMMNDDWGVSTYPMVAGHEGVGKITAMGEDVRNHKIGDIVGVGWIRNSCTYCSHCLEGKENLCMVGHQGTYLGKNAGIWGRDNTEMQGCFSEYVHINERWAFKIPPEWPLERAGPLMCGGCTTFNAVQTYAKAGTRIGIMGFGGLGTMASAFARAIGAEVFVLSHSESKRERAMRVGVNHFINYTDPQQFANLKGKLEVLIDVSSDVRDLKTFMELLGFDGTYVKIGIAPTYNQTFNFDSIPMIFTARKIASSVVGGTKAADNMIKVARCNNVIDHLPVEVIPFDKIVDGFKWLKEGKNSEFRYVLKW